MNETNDQNPSENPCPRCVAREQIEHSGATYGGISISAMKAYPLNLAAKLLGVSYQTIHKWIELGLIRMSPGKLVACSEIERMLAQDGRKRRRKRTLPSPSVAQ